MGEDWWLARNGHHHGRQRCTALAGKNVSWSCRSYAVSRGLYLPTISVACGQFVGEALSDRDQHHRGARALVFTQTQKLEPKRKLPETQNYRAFHPLHFELFCPHNAPPLSRIQLHKTAKRWLPPHLLSMSGANTTAGQLEPKVLIPSASIALSSPTSKRTSRSRSPLPSSMPTTRTSGFRMS